MSAHDRYHPSEAIADPKGYYERAFRNYPKPWLVKIVGRAAVLATRPTFSFHDAENEFDYFKKVEDYSNLVITFTHHGKSRFHDPIAGITAVFGTKYLRDRARNMNVWAAVPYMTHSKFGPIIERLGGVAVIRSGDYKAYDLEPTDEQHEGVRLGLLDSSVDHLSVPENILVNFPAGTKGGTKLRDGVGLVLERCRDTATIPISMTSRTQETGNLPRELKIHFGEIVTTDYGMTSADYMYAIDRSLNPVAGFTNEQ